MKKILFVTTALSGICLLATDAFAESPELIDHRSQGPENSETSSRYLDRQSPVPREIPNLAVKIAGVVRVDIEAIDQDLGGRRPGFSIFDTRRDFSILGAGTADNGVSYGFEIDITGNRAEMYISNMYGRVSLGDTYSATQALRVDGAAVMVGTGHYGRTGTENVNFGSLAGGRVVSYRGEGGTIRYTTPTYSGFTVSASYTQESDTDMIDGVASGSPDIGSEDIVSLATQHVSAYGNYITTLYAGYEWSNRNEIGTAGGDGNQALFSVGATVTGMGASVGGGYGYARHNRLIGEENDREWVDLALMYGFGAWQVSGGALYLIDEEGGGRHGEVHIFSGSFNYDLAPGLAIMGGVSHHEISDSTFDATNFMGTSFGIMDNEATTYTLSTQVTF